MIQQLPSFGLIPLTSIESTERWSLHSFLEEYSPPKVWNSIKHMGLLHPPTVQKLPSGRFLVVCGCFRIHSVQLLFPETTEIPCYILPQDASPQKTLDLIFEDQLLSGTLSPIEKAVFFKLCKEFLTNKVIATSYLPLLGEKIQEHSIDNVLQLLNLSPKIQGSVHNCKINEKLAYELLKLNSADRDSIHTLFKELGLGGGKQKRLLSLCTDLLGRDGGTIMDLMSGEDLHNILNHKEMNPPQKGALILDALHRRLFPESIAAEESFSCTIKAMNLPDSCSVSHSQSFESDAISLSIRFPTLSKMRQKLPEIQKIANN